jgi:hypothetical protein
MADLRYKVVGPCPVAGAAAGETVRADADDVDDHGRHLVGGERVNLGSAVAGGVIEPLSQAAAVSAEPRPSEADAQAGRG